VDPGPAPVHDVAAIRARCSPAGPEPDASPDGGGSADLITFGPHWPVPEQLYVGQDEQLALLVAPPATAAELDRYWLHPALFDRATTFLRLPDPETTQYLPLGYGRLLVRGPLPARVWSHVRYTGSGTDEVIAADVAVLDEDGREIVAVTDFLLRRVDAATMGSTVRAAPAVDTPSAAVATPSTGANGEIGIRPADGADAFRRLLGTDLGPQVVVTPIPLDQILAEVSRRTVATVEEDPPPAEPPPEQPRLLEGEYVAPRSELEATLAQIWGEVLGVGQVGVDDDFFELGGNSLVGVQLIAQVRKTVDVKLPMRTLFDTPTVAGMAARVAELRGTAAEADAADEPIPTLPRS
jgi:phthiocerol/phenolphthiocerol synthesis type-I polyketide synthase E